MKHRNSIVAELRRQNRLLRAGLAMAVVTLSATVLLGARAPGTNADFAEINAERINIVTPDGRTEMVLSNRYRLPAPVIGGEVLSGSDRNKPGLIFYNERGDENGGLIFDGNLDENGKPAAGMHFSMDRFGGDQQLALGHYENDGMMSTGLNIYDRGLVSEYGPLYDAWQATEKGTPEWAEARQKWIDAGGRQTPRVFVGRTPDQTSAVVLAAADGSPRIMMTVTPAGEPAMVFLDQEGNVIQSLPEAGATVQQ